MTGFGVILGNYVRRALVYRWIVLVPTVLVFALVTLNVTMQPDTYESYAILMPPITKPAEGSTAADTRDLGRDMFRSASERLLSTKMLARVAERCDPYPELSRRGELTRIVERLRKSVRIEVNRGTGSITVYATHSSGDEPAETAMRIANTLTDLFVESQRDALRDKATKLKKFLQQSKVKHRAELDRARKRLEEFQREHAGSLPEDIERNELDIERLAQRITDTRQNQRAYDERVRNLQSYLVRLDVDLRLAQQGQGQGQVAAAISATEALLRQAELELKQLELTYTADSEKIVRQKLFIDELNKQLGELRESERDPSARTREDYLKYLQDETRRSIERAQEERGILDDSIGKLEAKIEEAQQRIETGRKLQGQYLSHQRDVTDIEAEYEQFVMRLAAAETRAEYGEYDSATPIVVEQRAFVPAKPAGPERLVTSLVGLVIGLGIGVGLAVVHHRLDTSYQQADDLRALMPGAVLVTIPEVHTSGVRIGRAILGVLGGLVLTAVFAATVALLGVQVGWWGEPGLIENVLELR